MHLELGLVMDGYDLMLKFRDMPYSAAQLQYDEINRQLDMNNLPGVLMAIAAAIVEEQEHGG
jgi:hypothetical protein